jgi:magnesium chelatase family protein
LAGLYRHLSGNQPIKPAKQVSIEKTSAEVMTDFAEIKRQEHVKRALEVAAAGGHNVIMMGSPGAGKTLLARALPGVLPELSFDEALDVTRIYSVADQLPPAWSAEAISHTLAKSRWRTAVSFFSMNCRSLALECLR